MFRLKDSINVNCQLVGMLMLAFIWASIFMSSLMDTMNILVFFTLIVFLLTRNEIINPKLVASLSQWFLIVFIGFFALSFVSLILNDSDINAWYSQFKESVAPVIAVGFLSVLLIRCKIQERFLWLSLIGVTLSLITAVYLEWSTVGLTVFSDTYRFGQTKISTAGPLLIGVFSNLMTALLIAAAIWAYRQSSWLFFGVFFLSAILTIYVAFLSGTRGAWIGLPEIIIGWFFYFYFSTLKKMSVRKQFITIVTILFILMSLFIPIKDKINSRVSSAIKDVQLYLDGTRLGSIGIRLVMYEAAWDGIVQNPLSGYGIDKVESEMKERTKMIILERFEKEQAGFATSDVHNQYLQELFVRGIFGFIGFLIVQLYLLIFFIKRSGVNNLFAAAGTIFLLASIMNMMSYSWLRFHDGMFFYFIITTFLIYGANLKSKMDKKDE